MYYRDTDIDELMTDALVHTADTNNQTNYKNKIGYFLKSHPIKSSKDLINSTIKANTPASKSNAKVSESSHGTLPESVLIHPSIGYSFRYGNVMLSGLDNSIDYPEVNNGSWKP